MSTQQAIRISGQTFTITNIRSNTELVVQKSTVTAVSDAIIRINELPEIRNYILVNTVDTIDLS